MQQCWKVNPKSRPTFTQITNALESLIGSEQTTPPPPVNGSVSSNPTGNLSKGNLYQTIHRTPRSEPTSPEPSETQQGEPRTPSAPPLPNPSNSSADMAPHSDPYFTLAPDTHPQETIVNVDHDNSDPYFTLAPDVQQQEVVVNVEHDDSDAYATLAPDDDEQAPVTKGGGASTPTTTGTPNKSSDVDQDHSDTYFTLSPDAVPESAEDVANEDESGKPPHPSPADNSDTSYVTLSKSASDYGKVWADTAPQEGSTTTTRQDYNDAGNQDADDPYFTLERMQSNQDEDDNTEIRLDPELTRNEHDEESAF